MKTTARRAFLLAITASVTIRAAALEPGREDFAPVERAALKQQTVSKSAYCLWRAAGFGVHAWEEAAWIVRDGDELSVEVWPSIGRAYVQRWKGEIPRNAVGILHTHPARSGAWPSPHDLATAARLRMPVTTITRHGLLTAMPDGRVVEEAGSGWHLALALTARTCR